MKRILDQLMQTATPKTAGQCRPSLPALTDKENAMEIATDKNALSPELQHRLEEFEAQKAEYVEQQRAFQEATQETARLRAAAKALQAEADETNSTWKEMAKEHKADQRKINAQIERAVSLKQQAEGLHRTAEVREELHGTQIVGMADARLNLQKKAGVLNAAYRDERFKELLATAGLADVVAELFALNSARVHAERNEFERDISRPVIAEDFELRDRIEREEFGQMMADYCKGSAPGQGAFEVAGVPPAVPGEVIAGSVIALKRLKAAGGEIQDDIDSRGGNHGPIRGLRRV